MPSLTLTPDQWRERLDARLAADLPDLALRSAYYDGNHRLSFATAKFKEAFGELFEAFATNWCQLVVDAAVERLAIQGFRFGELEDADEDAWQIWQANNLDAGSIQAHTEAVKCRAAYLLVAPPRAPDGFPRISVEHPTQVVVEHDPEDRRRRLAALKKYQAADGAVVAVVYLPDAVHVFQMDGLAQRIVGLGLTLPTGIGGAWKHVSADENPLGVVPVVPLENNPNLGRGGTSDLQPAIALNDAANKFFTDMLVASEYAAFPQRVLTGVEIPKDPITGEPTEAAELRAAISRMWHFENDNARVTDLKPADLGNYVQAIDLAVQHLAAQTRTPPHYLLAKLVNLSGDALKAAETGLVARVRRKHIDFSDPWEEALRLAFKWRALTRRDDGDTAGADEDDRRAKMFDAETIWRDPETHAPGVISDSLVKKRQLGVPDEMLWEEAGYSPQQIRRMKAMREENALAASLADPFATTPGEPTVPAPQPVVPIEPAAGDGAG